MGIKGVDGTISGRIVNSTPSISGKLSAMPTSGGDYNKLVNHPSIEKHVLIGDSTIEQIGVGTMTVQEIEKILYLD